MTTPAPSLRLALERGFTPGGDLTAELATLGDYAVTSPDDAYALVSAASQLGTSEFRDRSGTGATPSPLNAVTGLFQSVDSREAFDILRERGIPKLLEAFDERYPKVGATGQAAEDLLFLLKVAGMYRVEGAIDRIIAAARRPLAPMSYLWSVLLSGFDETHPHRHRLFQALREPLPGGFIGVAFLDFANALLRSGHATEHPFDTTDGRARLRSFLTDPNDPSHAHSAAAALPFIARPQRDELLPLAMDHPSSEVQLEAAWAAGKLGSESALKYLARASLDPRTAKVAVGYLSELGHESWIPPAALDPDFRAVAEMAEWLAHPNEFGRAPDSIEVADSRELFWPPTADRRRLWLVRYHYEAQRPGARAEGGVGLVGSLTFALFGEATTDLPPEDLYALYCCWEMEVRGIPGAPRSRSIAAGRSILERSQPG